MLPLPSTLSWAVPIFAAAGVVSLAASMQLVAHIERAAGCFSLTDATIGLIAALCADAPEITSAATAVSHHQSSVGVGVVFGSNVFNLAALLGLAAVTTGRLVVRRRAALLEGVTATAVGLVAVLAAVGVLSVPVSVALSGVLLVVYAALTVTPPQAFRRLGLPASWASWLRLAVREEQQDAAEMLPRRERGRRALPHLALAAGALVLVVAASVVMEETGARIGAAAGWSMIATGAVLLAAVTSLPNAVAAVYLARRGRGGVVLAETMNSNALNVLAGFLVPALIVKVTVDSYGRLTAVWYLVMTAAILTAVIATGGLRRREGTAIIAVYLVFVAVLVAH